MEGIILSVLNNARLIASEKGIRLSHLCTVLGYGRSYFVDLEKTGRDIPQAKIPILAEALGVTTDYLLGHANDHSPSIKENPASGDESPRSGVDERVMSLLDQMTEDQKRQWIALIESFLRGKGIDPNTHRE